MKLTNPYHAGELQVQQRAGESVSAARNAGVIADTIPSGALPFLSKQSLIVLGSVDERGDPWASVLFGRPGFVSAPDDRSVRIDLTRAALHPHDPLWANLERDGRLGMLAIELETRRRLRVNGVLGRRTGDELLLTVAEAYPNCPKYIQRRHTRIERIEDVGSLEPPVDGEALGPEQLALLTRADTFFLASAHPEGGVDASHRGGPPGFVRVLGDRTLRIPDYAGNSMFNTLGNLAVHPRVGLVFVDFELGRTLQLTGRTFLEFDEHDPSGESGGTGRFLQVEVDRWRLSGLPATVRWEFLDASPFHPQPGAPGAA